MGFLTIAWAFLKRIPWWAYAAIALVAFHYIDRGMYASRKVDAATTEINRLWQERETKMLQEAADRLAAAIDAARAQEKRLEAELASLMDKYRKDLANVTAQKDRDIAAARSGALRLRLPASVCADSTAYGPPAPGAPRGDGAEGTYLPDALAADLLALANDADAVVAQLTACQQVILNDRSAQ